MRRGLVAGSTVAAALAGGFVLAAPAAAVHPGSPAQCTVQNASNVTVEGGGGLPVPDDSANGAASTMTISGAGTVIRDLDLKTFITHTYSGDLQLELTSPEGTVVRVWTGNTNGDLAASDLGQPGELTDVFNGTLWDDQSSVEGVNHQFGPGNGLEPTLVPEGALGAFVGENPNGTWTLKVADVAAGDLGTLHRWELDIDTLPEAPRMKTTNLSSTDTPLVVPDPGNATSTITVAGADPHLWDLDVTTHLRHATTSDVDMTLSHGGVTVSLNSDNGAGEDDVFDGTVWDDGSKAGGVPGTLRALDLAGGPFPSNAPTFVPEGAMAAFAGMDPNGTWTLTVVDDDGGDAGTLDGWDLKLVSSSGCNAAPNASFNVSSTTPTAGTGVNFADTSTDSDGTIASRAWDLDGDGQFDDSTGTNPSFTYGAAGTVNVGLRVTDNEGKTSTTSQAINVQAAVAGGPGGPTVTIDTATQVCGPPPAVVTGGKKGTAKYTLNQVKINQRVYAAALLRANTIEKWLNAGILTTDICGGGLGGAAFAASVTTGAASNLITLGPPSPRALNVPKLQNKKGVKFRLNRGQLVINRRIALALKDRALALQARMDGKLNGGDLAAGTLGRNALNNGLRIASVSGAPAPPRSKTAIKKVSKAPSITLTAKTLRDNQKLGSDAIKILNELRDRINGGLTDDQFAPGTITGASINGGIVG